MRVETAGADSHRKAEAMHSTDKYRTDDHDRLMRSKYVGNFRNIPEMSAD